MRYFGDHSDQAFQLNFDRYMTMRSMHRPMSLITERYRTTRRLFWCRIQNWQQEVHRPKSIPRNRKRELGGWDGSLRSVDAGTQL